MRIRHKEQHKIQSIGWLRAAVLGANDGIVSTASLVLGVTGAHADRSGVLAAAIAGLIGGALSMAAGEYVSVSSLAEAEAAALDEERSEIEEDSKGELRELVAIYVRRGLDLPLATQVATKLMQHNALEAHARDELGITKATSAKPLLAAGASACSFAAGAALPLVIVALAPMQWMALAVAPSALIALAALGALAAKTGGARLLPGVVRVTFWSALAMAATYTAGRLFGASGI